MYRTLSTAKFGESLKLPAPFDLVIDTSEFPGGLTHPSSAATTTRTGTDRTVESRIASRARTSPTR